MERRKVVYENNSKLDFLQHQRFVYPDPYLSPLNIKLAEPIYISIDNGTNDTFFCL